MLRCKDKVVVVAGQLTLGTLKVLVESSAGGVYKLIFYPVKYRLVPRRSHAEVLRRRSLARSTHACLLRARPQAQDRLAAAQREPHHVG